VCSPLRESLSATNIMTDPDVANNITNNNRNDYFLPPKTFLIDKKFLLEPIGKLFPLLAGNYF
jgi:hypothetical protein